MKKIYLTFGILLVLGIAAGIFYLQVVRPGSAELPNDVVLETAYGEDFTFEDMPEKTRLIEFMYTDCPDVCPTTTLEMSKLKNKLENEDVFGDDVEFLTITINPSEDTPEVLQDYAEQFEVSPDDGWLFLRADEQETEKVADSLGFLYRDPGTGDIIHSTYAYFLDENNKIVEQFSMGNGFDTDKAYNRIMSTIN